MYFKENKNNYEKDQHVTSHDHIDPLITGNKLTTRKNKLKDISWVMFS